MLPALVLAFTLKLFVVGAIMVPTHSMESTLLPGDFVLIDKLVMSPRPDTSPAEASLFHLPVLQRGDVIVFDAPEIEGIPSIEEGQRFVKRCIGLPGDVVAMSNGSVYVNGTEMKSPERAATGLGNDATNDFGPVTVPYRGMVIPLSGGVSPRWKEFIRREGHTLSLSATEEVLIDGMPSREYTVERNYLFVLGDNRRSSLDSRSWGFLPADSVVGKAIVIYWSRNQEASDHDRAQTGPSIRWNRIGSLIR